MELAIATENCGSFPYLLERLKPVELVINLNGHIYIYILYIDYFNCKYEYILKKALYNIN